MSALTLHIREVVVYMVYSVSRINEMDCRVLAIQEIIDKENLERKGRWVLDHGLWMTSSTNGKSKVRQLRGGDGIHTFDCK